MSTPAARFDTGWFDSPRPWTINEHAHWGRQDRQEWMTVTGVALRRAGITRWAPDDPRPVTVTVHLSFPQLRRRDPHNYTGTVVKAIVDTIVKTGAVPDDTADWVTVIDPVLEVHTAHSFRAKVVIDL